MFWSIYGQYITRAYERKKKSCITVEVLLALGEVILLVSNYPRPRRLD